ncbi:MAG: hypothetical protein EBR09_06065 [Proteobacteria bacterium]|nr:hypothetical protein [Pseudomonadota bacterium]
MKHVVAGSAELPNSSQQSTKFAAVAYLNMLPFFADDPSVELHSTPRALNSIQPKAHAYCSSLIAGLNSGKNPVSTTSGVFSSGAVQSVYIEPHITTEAHAEFWHRLESLWAHRQPNPVAALSDSESHGKIVLRTCGASEQSVWMVKVLTALAGFSLEVIVDANSGPQVRAEKSPPEARLWIGDPALERRLSHKNAYRIDIGEVWNSHTGHKAWFAGWFAGSAYSEKTGSELTDTLHNKTRDWASRSEFSRWCAIFKFLELQKSSLIGTRFDPPAEQVNLSQEDQSWDLRDMLADYFSALEFSIAAEEGEQLLSFYKKMGAALSGWELAGKSPAPAAGILKCTGSSVTDTHGNLNQ